MNLRRKSGVYEIRNTTNNKRYIGSSKDLAERFRRHKRDLRRGKHHSRYLQRAWNKYGEEAFVFNLLEFRPAEKLMNAEDLYLLLSTPEYNTNLAASSSAGTKSSEETKAKIGAAIRKLGIRPPESTWKDRRKRVSAVDPKTDLELKTFDSVAEACRWMGRDHRWVTMISRCCNGKSKSGLAWGLKWKWEPINGQ